MGIEITPIPAYWDVQLDQNVLLLKHSFAVNNFGIWNDVSALDLNLGIDRTASFNNLIDSLHLDPKYKDAGDELKKINSDTVQAGQDQYKEFSSAVENLKNKTPDKAQWELDIDLAATETKKKSNQAIDDAAAGAKEVISKLPSEARQTAADGFLAGYRAVARFFQNVWTQIKVLAESVYQFLLGVWDKITSAWNTVTDAAKAAVSWIEGLFGQQSHLSKASSTSQTSPVATHNDRNTASPAEVKNAAGGWRTSTGGSARTGELKGK